MNGDSIFLTSGDDLVPLAPRPYDSEAVLQRALAEHPEVIAGQTTAGEAGALLLVRREMGVPAVRGGPNVWSVDHLFVDGDGVPVIVEVKRASDTRIRREVVGQMLDYAANGVRHWPVETLRAAVEQQARDTARQPEELLAERLGVDDPEVFWSRVADNLENGRVRLLFVADALPPELVAVIEFLNDQMARAEVLGVALRQYAGDGHVVYVPTVVGRTTKAQERKAATAGRLWDEASFLAAARERRPPEEVDLIERLLRDAARLGWGRGVTPGVSGWYDVAGQQAPVWNLNVNAPGARAYLYVYLGDLVKRLPAERVEAFAAALSRVPALAPKIAEARELGWNKYPSVYLADVVGDAAVTEALLAAFAGLRA